MSVGGLLSVIAGLLGNESMTVHFFGEHFSWKLVDQASGNGPEVVFHPASRIFLVPAVPLDSWKANSR